MNYQMWIKTRSFDQDYRFLGKTSAVPAYFDALIHFNELSFDLKKIDSAYYLYVSGLSSQRKDIAGRVIRYTLVILGEQSQIHLLALIHLLLFKPHRLVELLEQGKDLEQLYHSDQITEYLQAIDQQIQAEYLHQQQSFDFSLEKYQQWLIDNQTHGKVMRSSLQPDMLWATIQQIFTLNTTQSIAVSFISHLDHITKYEEYFDQYQDKFEAHFHLLIFRNAKLVEQHTMLSQASTAPKSIFQKIKLSISQRIPKLFFKNKG